MSLVETLRRDFPAVLFVATDGIPRWLPEEKTIYYTDGDDANLLHELGHALLGHKSFTQDVELLHSERDAWEKAREIGERYGVKISEKRIEDAMDKYRDWLHERSLCPDCGQTGLQRRSDSQYECFNCLTVWKANDARICALRRKLAN